ncbi:hypothetical protein BJX61DRAFT_530962 [Aspergillus egyptiacus]|nr:hypothetical protein BJX61DRAFT_530962 [Aspergillus egyptiacus]
MGQSNSKAHAQRSSQSASPDEQADQPLQPKEPHCLHGKQIILVLVLPWTLTIIMMFRPVMKPSYINQRGEYSVRDIWNMDRWRVATHIIDGIASVIAVPTVSALLGYGAVVYTQRRKQIGQRELNVGQMFTLADRGWSDIPTVWLAWREKKGKLQNRPPYLLLAVVLVLLAAIQPPLKQLLIDEEAKTVVTCNDIPVYNTNDDSTCDKIGMKVKVVGQDPEPPFLAHCPQNTVVQRTTNKLIDVRTFDVQVHLWREVSGDNNVPELDQMMNTFAYYAIVDNNSTFFTSSVINGTTTGVLREHAVRMDTNVTCKLDHNFPVICPGKRPFTTHIRESGIDMSVCANGSYDSVPWRNTRDAQNVTETLWIRMNVEPEWDYMHLDIDTFTLRCDAVSRRGWFELGNYQNGFTHQPMLETWPDDDAMLNQFNDFSSDPFKWDYWPVKEEPDPEYFEGNLYSAFPHIIDPFGSADLPTPGPLMTAALALFGNGTFFHAAGNAANATQQHDALQQVCEYRRIPFASFYPSSTLVIDMPSIRSLCDSWFLADDRSARAGTLPLLVAHFMQAFSVPEQAQKIFEISTFFANEALLTVSADSGIDTSRKIYEAQGYVLLKPRMSIPGIVVISSVITLQIAALALLMRFIYSAPTWTASLDAAALARIGAQLHHQGWDGHDFSGSGIVGIGEVEDERRNEGSNAKRRKVKILGLGEPGVVSKQAVEHLFG